MRFRRSTSTKAMATSKESDRLGMRSTSPLRSTPLSKPLSKPLSERAHPATAPIGLPLPRSERGRGSGRGGVRVYRVQFVRTEGPSSPRPSPPSEGGEGVHRRSSKPLSKPLSPCSVADKVFDKVFDKGCDEGCAASTLTGTTKLGTRNSEPGTKNPHEPHLPRSHPRGPGQGP